MLAVRDDGLVAGSVSGGCIEDDIIDRTRREGMTATQCQAVTYGVSADEARRFGLPCGGTIQLVLEPLRRDSGVRGLLREIEAGHLVARRLDLASGQTSLHPARATDGLVFDGATLVTIHGPRYRMLVIGASQLSKYLAQIAVGLDSQVRARNTWRRGTSRASRSCARCPTTPWWRWASTSDARWWR